MIYIYKWNLYDRYQHELSVYVNKQINIYTYINMMYMYKFMIYIYIYHVYVHMIYIYIRYYVCDIFTTHIYIICDSINMIDR